jgi:hypothetical protein
MVLLQLTVTKTQPQRLDAIFEHLSKSDVSMPYKSLLNS